MSITQTDQQYVASTYGRFPLELVSGKGSRLTSSEGKQYIDLTSGIGVTSFGIADDLWVQAVTAQLTRLQHTSNLYYTEPCARLAQTLCERTGLKKVFFSNSGAEANECAIKYARKYSAWKKGPEYHTIITLTNSFHGRTLTTLAATGQAHYHELFQPLTPGFVHVAAGDRNALAKAAASCKPAGILLECIQGEGGVIPLDREYLQFCQRLCQEQDIPLMIDEVQTGNGRTGALYAYMHFQLQPDIVSTAKGLGGGLPIGATLLGEKVCHMLGPGEHGSTYGGNPVACAGALSIVSRLDGHFLEEVTRKGSYIRATLDQAPGVLSVTGMGLMVGIETVLPAAQVVQRCMEKGVLCLTAKNKVRLLPPLNIPQSDLETALDILKEAMKGDSQ